jgi:hypothetical protein
MKLKSSNSSSCKPTTTLLIQDIKHNMVCMKTSFHVTWFRYVSNINKWNSLLAIHLIVFTCKLYEESSKQPVHYVKTATRGWGLWARGLSDCKPSSQVHSAWRLQPGDFWLKKEMDQSPYWWDTYASQNCWKLYLLSLQNVYNLPDNEMPRKTVNSGIIQLPEWAISNYFTKYAMTHFSVSIYALYLGGPWFCSRSGCRLSSAA